VSELDFDALAAARVARKAALVRTVAAGGAEPATPTARQRLEQLLDADTLAELDEHVLSIVAPDGSETEISEPEPEPGFFDLVRSGQEAGRRTFMDAVLGRPPAPPAPTERDERGRFVRGGFDGGARRSAPPPPQTHEQWLVSLLGTHPADRPGRFTPAR
jgi:hypothetical protein